MKRVILLIIIIVSFAFMFFFWGGNKLTAHTIKTKIEELRDSTNFNKKNIFTLAELDSLPQLLSKYFETVLVDNSLKPNFITLGQTAYIKTDEDSEWMKIDATECFTTVQPNFLWNSTLQNSDLFWVQSIDSYIHGNGNMLIKLNSSITIADAWNVEMDKSGLFRYFSEALFFPTSLLPNKNLHWNVLDSNTAEVKFVDEANSIVAKVFFAKDNTIEKIETMDKFRTTHGGYVKTPYTIYYSNYKWLNENYFVPTHFEVEWDLPDGKFRYGKFDVTHIKYE
ncbi:MAG: DUF6544 family protein [Melioribacteraceae bacterium]